MSEEQTNAESPKPKTSRLATLSFICGLLTWLSPGFGICLILLVYFSQSAMHWLGQDFARITGYSSMLYAPPFFCIASIILCIAALIVIKLSKGKLKGKARALYGPAVSIGFIVWAVIMLFLGPWRALLRS